MIPIISLTTIPSRLSDGNELAIKQCIDSLITQNFGEYEIHFNIPAINKMTQEPYVIPEWISSLEKIKIFQVEDIGPFTKSFYTVQRVTEPETVIVVVDDDLVYHPDMLAEHVKNHEIWKEEILGYDGLRSRNEDGSFSCVYNDSRDYYYSAQKRDSRVDILQHYKSVSYKRRYFESDFVDFVNTNFNWNDDVLLASYFAFKKRDRMVVAYEHDVIYNTYDEWINNAGVTTFPVLRHTHHEGMEGCNLFRQKSEYQDFTRWFVDFIDKGYIK